MAGICMLGSAMPQEVARFDLAASPITSVRIPLGNSQWGSANYAEDLEVLDGDGTSFLMAGSDDHAAAVFDSATGMRANRTGIYTVDRIERTGTAGTFVGYNNYTSGYDLTSLPVTLSGVTASAKVSNVIKSFGADIAGSGNLLFSSTGQLANSNTLTLSYDLSTIGRPCVDGANQRAYLVNGNALRAFNTNDGSIVATLALPVTTIGDWAQSCIRWGTTGIAILGGDGNIYITRWGQANILDTNGNGILDSWETTTLGALTATVDDDPDHDGIPNALEYLYGTSPTTANFNPMVVKLPGAAAAVNARTAIPAFTTHTVTLEFPRRVGLPTDSYGFESTVDLTTWTAVSPLSETVISTNNSTGVAIDTVQAVLPLPLDNKGFVRMVWKLPTQ